MDATYVIKEDSGIFEILFIDNDNNPHQTGLCFDFKDEAIKKLNQLNKAYF